MRLQTGTELISAEERERVEKVCESPSLLTMHLLYIKPARLADAVVMLLQKFAANMEHWLKRRKIFKSIWCGKEPPRDACPSSISI